MYHVGGEEQLPFMYALQFAGKKMKIQGLVIG